MATEKASDDKAYAQLRYMQNVYSQHHELIEEQIATYSLSLDSMRKGVQFLNDSKQADKKKTLISIGGGAYVEALFPDIRSALVYVGAGYLVERSVAEAKAIVEDNKNKQEEMLKKLDAERRKLQSELISISYRIETMQQQQV